MSDLDAVQGTFDFGPFGFGVRAELNDGAAKDLAFLPAIDLRNASVKRRYLRVHFVASSRSRSIDPARMQLQTSAKGFQADDKADRVRHRRRSRNRRRVLPMRNARFVCEHVSVRIWSARSHH